MVRVTWCNISVDERLCDSVCQTREKLRKICFTNFYKANTSIILGSRFSVYRSKKLMPSSYQVKLHCWEMNPKGQVFLSLLYTAQSQGHRTLHSTEETFKKYVIELNLIEIVQFLLLPFWKKLLQLGKVISKLKTQQPIFITKQKINLPMEHKIYVLRINMCFFFLITVQVRVTERET